MDVGQVLAYLGDGGVMGGLVLVVVALWRGWVVPSREVDAKDRIIASQAETIERLEATNDRLLGEISGPLRQVLDAVSRRR